MRTLVQTQPGDDEHRRCAYDLAREAWHGRRTPVYTPNRAPSVEVPERIDLGNGLHVGVFAAPIWRKNVVTQIAAVSLLDGATAHVMRHPDVAYLSGMDVVEHGELPWAEFVRLQGSVDLNLYVSLSACHPLAPVESYLAGVPCLVSRTSTLFRDDRDLWDLVSVSQADDPVAIAAAAGRLLDAGPSVVEEARRWIGKADGDAAHRWREFITAAARRRIRQATSSNAGSDVDTGRG